MHARRGVHIVVIGADRVAAARLAAEQGAEVIVCDDGLQHVRLARDYEIAVVDGARGLGNRWLLPAGPLREPARELESVHAVVVTERGGEGRADFAVRSPMLLRAQVRRSATPSTCSRANVARWPRFRGRPTCTRSPASAIPEAFFRGLAATRVWPCKAHALPDHAPLDAGDAAVPRGRHCPDDRERCRKMRGRSRAPTGGGSNSRWSIGRADAAALLTSVLERTGLTGAGVSLG